MLSNRDDKQGEHEESEYHFSDDDASYEIESDASKPASSEASGFMSRLTGSKRMLISLGVFVLLVFVVYKMVTPGSSVPPTDISPQAAAQSAPQKMPMTTSEAPAAPALSEQPIAQAEPATQPAMSVSPDIQQPVTASPANTPASPPPMERPVEQGPEVVVSMPPVIPVQSNVSANPVQPVAPPVQTTPTNVDAAIASMASTNEKLMNQLQSDYTQRLNEYSNQNKEMQGQIQTLNTRVANMEAQMNQLVQILTRPQEPATNSPPGPPPGVSQAVPVQQAGPDVKVNYSVQAIIPGRAWLRSESGETVTVAEGDTIKELGRVTKIDPYDGVVEVNTGNKVVSISYGTTE